MDTKTSVAHRILDRRGERAIAVMQSHRVWGDVFDYFHRERWYTLRIKTDAFTYVSVRRGRIESISPVQFFVVTSLDIQQSLPQTATG